MTLRSALRPLALAAGVALVVLPLAAQQPGAPPAGSPPPQGTPSPTDAAPAGPANPGQAPGTPGSPGGTTSASVCQSTTPGGSISVTPTGALYPIATAAAAGGTFRTGQDADVVLSAVRFNNAGGPLLFNHPTGIATDGTRLLLADRFNNRVLIWTTLPASEADEPTLVLGQADFVTNDPGTGPHQMSWPGAVSVSPQGAVVVADSYNDRLLIWNTFPTRNAQPADVVLTHGDLGWPWGVWTDGSRLAATSTNKSKVLFWNTLPTSGNPAPSFTSTGGGHLGTPRTITTNGRWFAVGDHNSRGGGGDIATHVWTSYPTGDTAPDFAMRDPIDSNYAWLTGDFTSRGELVMFGRYLHLYEPAPTAAATAPRLSLQQFPWSGGDGAAVAVAGDRIFVSMYNGNRIVVHRTVPTADTDPDFAVGAPDLCTNTLDSRFFITNGVPATDGRSLWVSSDFDRRMYVWKDIPDDSGAAPDYVYRLPEAPWDSEVSGDRLALAGQKTVYLWNTLPRAGEAPDVTFSDRIGSANFTRLMGVAMGGGYFALSDDSGKVWFWNGIPSADHEPVTTLQLASPRRLHGDSTHFVITRTDPGAIFVYRWADVGPGMQPVLQLDANSVRTRFNMNLPEHAIIRNGELFLADTINNRVLYWSSLESARSQAPEVIFGAANLNDVTPEIGRNKMFWPAAMAYDGARLWVGEYKFSNRVLR
ncbi:MAG: hypothetical protein AB7P67_13315, partial [Vicinamibacterales bacterium]